MVTALYLAHLNPLTKAHVEIINELKKQSDQITVMPVIFLKNGIEINSRSFPFTFEIREQMLISLFGDSVKMSRNYTFYAPYFRYLPPLLSPFSWKIRKEILKGVEGDYFTYTGDKAEGYMLKFYGLKPKVGKRKEISAASVKDKIYSAAMGHESDWKKDVPNQVVKIIENNWGIVKKFANARDQTTRVAGMKFPKDGYWKK